MPIKNKQRYDTICQTLTDALAPFTLELTDESHKHIGHPGAQTGMSHYALAIGAEKLEGLSSIKQHRLIYASLGTLMQTDIHALRIRIIKKAQLKSN